MSYAETLRSKIANLSPNRQEFARDLLRAYDAGRVSVRQAEWIEKLARDADTRESAAQASPETVALLNPLFELFAKAKANGLTRPKPIHVLADRDDVALSLAGPDSRNAGSIYVKRNDEYLGKISPAGELRLAYTAKPYEVTTIKRALEAFAADPAGVAAAYGRETSTCCFCSIALSDPRSVHVGYGPICAENYGLPWGENDPTAPEAPKKKARKAKKSAAEPSPAENPGDTISENPPAEPQEAQEPAPAVQQPAVTSEAATPPARPVYRGRPVQLCLAL